MYLCIGERNCQHCFVKDCALKKEIRQTNKIEDKYTKKEYK